MKIINGKIAECTEKELYDYYIERDMPMCGISFPQYMLGCQVQGTKIVKESDGNED